MGSSVNLKLKLKLGFKVEANYHKVEANLSILVLTLYFHKSLKYLY